jgi:2-phospho-L-lactate guanylyltransferase
MWALLPVKALEKSKTRLAGVLNPQECHELALSMATDMVAALEAAQQIDGIAVLTTDAAAIRLGQQRGYRIMHETTDLDLNVNIDAAAGQLAAGGIETLLIVPSDLPTITAADIDELCRLHSNGLSVCPAIRDGGTNACLCTPPAAVPAQFGPDSARMFIAMADKLGVDGRLISLPAFERDIDRPDDLAWLLDQEAGQHTSAFLSNSNIRTRLQAWPLGATA